MTAPPSSLDLAIYRGDTYHWRFWLWADSAGTSPIDLTGASAKAEIRDKPSGAKISAMACVITDPNQIDMTLDAQTSGLVPNGQWDLQITYASGSIQTVLRGRALVTDDITDSTRP